MTIILGVNLEDFVLILADTRLTSCNVKGEIGGCNDDYEKIFKTEIGLVAGGGNARLFNIFKDQVISSKIVNLKTVLRILNRAYDSYLSNPPVHPQETTAFKNQSISESSWFFSEYNQHMREIKLIFAPCSARFSNKKYTILPPGFPLVQMQCNDDKMENIRNYFENEIRLTKSDSIKCAQKIAYLFGRFIKNNQAQFTNISTSFQIGIHKINGNIEISGIIKDAAGLEKFISTVLSK